MPAAAAIPIAIQLASTVLPTAINAVSNWINNRNQKKFAEKQYQTQRADNLSDWERQNQYNSPMAQMSRFNEAGLNPHLIYKGGANATAGDVGKASFGNYSPNATRFDVDIAETLSKFQNYENQKVQTDNLRAELEIKRAQEQLIKANVLKTLKGTDKLSFDILKGQTLLDYQAEAAKETIRNIASRTQFTLDQNQRAWIMQSSKLEETLARISLAHAQQSKIPFEISILKEQAENLRTKNYWLGISEAQKKQLNNLLMESRLINNTYQWKQMEEKDTIIELNKLKAGFMKAGVSPQVTENMLKTIFGVLSIRKGK